MWEWIKGRLDRRWKRVAFVIWMPLLFLSFLMFVYAAVDIYMVRYSDDDDVLSCHYRMARRRTPLVMGDTFDRTDDQKAQLARDRFYSRRSFESQYSSEARQVERTPEFSGCMSNTASASWWLEYPFVWPKIVGFFFWNALIALIILPRFWRSLGEWIKMKPSA
jgi:hypothetical protein